MKNNLQCKPGSAQISQAVKGVSLYLANLLVAPGLAFLLLLVWWWKSRFTLSSYPAHYLAASLRSSLIAGALLLGPAILALIFSDLSKLQWMTLIIYMIVTHGVSVLWGVYLIARAMAGKDFIYGWLTRGPACSSRIQ